MSTLPPYQSETVHEEHVAGAPGGPVAGATPVAGTPVAAPGTVAAPAAVQPAAAAGSYTRVSRSASVFGNPRAWKWEQIVWFVLAVIETLIGLRVLLLALGANPEAGFTRFIRDVSSPFVAPFRGIFKDYGLGNTGVLDVGSIVAMIVWAIAAYLVVRLIDILASPDGRRSTATY